MREMKFRAWLKKEKKMFPVHSLNFSAEEDEPVEVAYCGNVNCPMCTELRKRDEVEIMQYTGLKDKNGKEIYEGDVIRTHFSFGNEVSQEPFVIIWDKEKAMFKGIKPEHSKDDYLASFSFFPEQRFIYEVIGNIHENPELLEVKG